MWVIESEWVGKILEWFEGIRLSYLDRMDVYEPTSIKRSFDIHLITLLLLLKTWMNVVR